MFVNAMPRYEILSEDAIAVIDRGWRRLVSEIGIEFLLPEAVELLTSAGQTLEDENRIRFDPEFILEQIAKAPREFDLQARNPANTAHIGGDHMVFAPVYGCPFIREGTPDATPRWPTSRTSSAWRRHSPSSTPPAARSASPRTGRWTRATSTWCSRSRRCRTSRTWGRSRPDPTPRTRSGWARSCSGDVNKSSARPVSISLINVNSPLRYDDRMLAAMFEYVKANQAVVITPFLLMGAMSPVSLPATLVQQVAEALAGIALAQLIRPGAPVVFGSFLSNTDMQSGSPSFGTPESGIGVLCTGQIARHFGLPWRGGGGLNASQTVDAQAAYESLMTHASDVPGRHQLRHALGRVARGRARVLL